MRIIDLHKPGWGSIRDAGALVYCGRPMPGWAGSPLANPFTPKLHGKEAIRFYREWLKARLAEDWPPALLALRAIGPHSVLACWCAQLDGDAEVLAVPMQCHCQVIWRAWLTLNGGGDML